MQKTSSTVPCDGKILLFLLRASLVAQTVKHLLTMRETRVRSLGQEDPLEKAMAAHSSTLAWGSEGKTSACNAGDPGSIPGSGRSPGEGDGDPLQYSGLENSMDYMVAQRVKPVPAMRETRVRSLGQEHPLEKEMATHSSILAWKILWTEEPCVHGVARVGHN